MNWRFILDQRRAVPTLVDGGAIPFTPGLANDIDWESFAPGCRNISCLPLGQIENKARAFLSSHQEIFRVTDGDLVLDPAGSVAVGASMYYLRFQWNLAGIPVEGASVNFRINNGNLIQVATKSIGPIALDPNPAITVTQAHSLLGEFLGPFASTTDRVLNEVVLGIIPITPVGQDPDNFVGAIGSGIDYKLVYRIAFERPGVIGTWEALIDAHTGDILRFVDANRYGRIHGGAYPGENHTGEADRPFPFADTGLPAPDDFAGAGGLFDGDNATTTLVGKYTWITDFCGSISNTTTVGDVDFMLGPGTDCDVPTGNTGGAGNTHAARTLYYHVTNINIKARTYMPNNSWLNNNHMNVNVNQSPWCNATSGGGTINFYRADTGCWNLGEIPGVALHEWGHSMDDFDGSGGGSPPVETRADWTGILQTHDSCLGRGFFLSGNCGGYGDPCLDCNGIRDSDYTQHAAGVPWTTDNYGSVWSCSGGSYFGPCGWSDHCESGFASQALWDMVTIDLVGPPTNMDTTSAWILNDRLFYTSMSSLGNMYSCSGGVSNGCNGGGLYANFMAIDDDGDGTANGTPHAAAIFAALDRHGIACGTATDPENMNQTSCPGLVTPTVIGTGGNNSAELSWDAVINATRYFVYRNEIDCNAGYTKVAEVGAPTTDFTDTEVVNGIEYYYRVQAATASDSCTSAMSTCLPITPVPCETPVAPSSLTASPDGDNRIALTWSSTDPVADTFRVYRALGTCPQAEYELIATDVPVTGFVDDPVSGQVNFAYMVAAADSTQGCESLPSNCSATQTTGPCTLAPTFSGIEFVTNQAASTCGLDLGWAPANAPCGGAVTYNIYRDTIDGFTPGDSTRIVTGYSGTSYSDNGNLEPGTTHYYIVRAVDGSNAAEDDNLVMLSGTPTGPSTIALSDDFESGNQGWVFSLGSPAASTGDFLIGDPVGTTGNYGDASQPEDDHTPGGVNCLYTDENPTGQMGTDDVDNGEVIATSPTFDGSGMDALRLELWRWFFNEDTDDAGDYFFLEVSNDNGSNWTVLENIPDSNTTTNSWTAVVFDIETMIPLTSTMKIRVRAADGTAAGDLIEAAIDDVVITGWVNCTAGQAPPFFEDGFETGDVSAWSVTVP